MPEAGFHSYYDDFIENSLMSEPFRAADRAKLASIIKRVDAIFAFTGFEPSPSIKATDKAALAGVGTWREFRAGVGGLCRGSQNRGRICLFENDRNP